MNNNGNRKECFLMSADILLTHFNQLFCPNSLGHPLYGKRWQKQEFFQMPISCIKDGKILAVGAVNRWTDWWPEWSCEGRIATPGLIDCHTRESMEAVGGTWICEKLAGVSYLDILAQGGGILGTVRATRELFWQSLWQVKRLLGMLRHGVTTVEAKSGLWFGWETENASWML